MGVQVFVMMLTGERKEVKVCETVEQLQRITVLQLKEEIIEEFDLPHPGFVRLAFRGKHLDDDQYLSHYGVQHGSILHMILRSQSSDGPQTGVHVFVKTLTGKTETMKVCETVEQLYWITVRQLKEKIIEAFDLPPDVEFFRLTFTGKLLDDYQYLSDYGVQHGSFLHMVFRLGRAERPQMGVQVTVKKFTGETKEIKVCETVEQLQSITVLQLKEKIQQKSGNTCRVDETDLRGEAAV